MAFTTPDYDTSTANNRRSLLIDVGPMNQSVEHMVGAIVGYRSTLEIFRQRYAGDQEQMTRIHECEVKLNEAQRAAMPEKWWHRRKIFTAWNLLHQVCEEFFLLLIWDELLAEGRKLYTDMGISSIPSMVKQAWQTEIKKCLEVLETEPGKHQDDCDSKKHACRQTLKMAMNTLNTQMDTLFWDIWVKKLFITVYTLMLFALLVALYIFYPCSPPTEICLNLVFTLGAIGGVASGIMTGEPMYMSKGHFWVSGIYYVFSRPVQGALAALIMFWMLQSQYLIKIGPDPAETAPAVNAPTVQEAPAKRAAKAKTARKSSGGVAATQTPEAAPAPTETPAPSKVPATKDTFIVLNAVDGKQIYLYMLVLLIAGFTGDKLLKTVSEKVTKNLFNEAEKTKESKVTK